MTTEMIGKVGEMMRHYMAHIIETFPRTMFCDADDFDVCVVAYRLVPEHQLAYFLCAAYDDRVEPINEVELPVPFRRIIDVWNKSQENEQLTLDF